ncbi:MAG: helix-turn-helix transcriptional regulator [Actinomycetota bacterium]
MAKIKDEAAAELGRRIRNARRARGWTQERLAGEAGVGRDAVLRLEKGHRNARPSTISRVAGALGLDHRDLLLAEPGGGAPGTTAEAAGAEDERALLALAKRRARAEGISEDEALGRLYREHVLFRRVASGRRFGLPRGERPVMANPDASTEALGAVRGS